jgi:hypothetical protein
LRRPELILERLARCDGPRVFLPTKARRGGKELISIVRKGVFCDADAVGEGLLTGFFPCQTHLVNGGELCLARICLKYVSVYLP